MLTRQRPRWKRSRSGPHGKHTGRRLRLAVGLCLLAVAAVAGCSSQPTNGAFARAASLARGDQGMVDFTRCMRAHGTPMSDPSRDPGHTGLSIDLPPQDAATRAAYQACSHFIAALVQAKLAGQAARSPQALAALTRYAQCMRGHDISMRDPSPLGQLTLGNVPGMTASFGRYSPQFRSADAACRHLLPAGIPDDGSGP